MGKKGFTLIEILIVIVIIAILAAIMMPRILPQTERAYVAEAVSALGIMTRTQNQLMELRNDNNWLECKTNDAFKKLLSVDVEKITRFTFNCSTSSCTATRKDQPTRTIMFLRGGGARCGEGYSPVIADEEDGDIVSCI